MDERKIIQMIDEYLTEPHSISNEWVQALLVCKQALIDNKKKDIEIDILIRKKETLRDEITERKAEIDGQDVEIMRLKHEIERLHNLQNPTEVSGFKVENGKVVFYTNMLNGYRHEFKDLEAVVRDLNLMLQNSYKNDQIIGLYKNTLENQVSKLKVAKSEAYKNLTEKLYEKIEQNSKFGFAYVTKKEIENVVRELEGEEI